MSVYSFSSRKLTEDLSLMQSVLNECKGVFAAPVAVKKTSKITEAFAKLDTKRRVKESLSDEQINAVLSDETVDLTGVDRDEFIKGLKVEAEHDDLIHGDLGATAKIALAHLRELPDYYTRLAKMEGGTISDKIEVTPVDAKEFEKAAEVESEASEEDAEMPEISDDMLGDLAKQIKAEPTGEPEPTEEERMKECIQKSMAMYESRKKAKMQKVSESALNEGKASFGNADKFSYAVQVNGLSSNEFYKQPFGRQLDDAKKVKAFVDSAKSAHVGAKGKSTMAEVKSWIRDVKPTEFYAKWKADSSDYKDDSVQVFYKGGSLESANESKKLKEEALPEYDRVVGQVFKRVKEVAKLNALNKFRLAGNKGVAADENYVATLKSVDEDGSIKKMLAEKGIKFNGSVREASDYKNNKIKAEFVRAGDFNDIYKDESGREYANVGGVLYTFSKDYEEPISPVGILVSDSEEFTQKPQDKHNYMMLSRLQSDVKYAIGEYYHGTWDEKKINDFIADMRKLYAAVPVKPEWISEEDINRYEKELKSKFGGSQNESVNESDDDKEEDATDEHLKKLFELSQDSEHPAEFEAYASKFWAPSYADLLLTAKTPDAFVAAVRKRNEENKINAEDDDVERGKELKTEGAIDTDSDVDDKKGNNGASFKEPKVEKVKESKDSPVFFVEEIIRNGKDDAQSKTWWRGDDYDQAIKAFEDAIFKTKNKLLLTTKEGVTLAYRPASNKMPTKETNPEDNVMPTTIKDSVLKEAQLETPAADIINRVNKEKEEKVSDDLKNGSAKEKVDGDDQKAVERFVREVCDADATFEFDGKLLVVACGDGQAKYTREELEDLGVFASKEPKESKAAQQDEAGPVSADESAGPSADYQKEMLAELKALKPGDDMHLFSANRSAGRDKDGKYWTNMKGEEKSHESLGDMLEYLGYSKSNEGVVPDFSKDDAGTILKKITEQDNPVTYDVKARGIDKAEDAQMYAKNVQNATVIADDADKTKFMVVVKKA